MPPPPATGIGFRVATGANPPSGALRNGDSIRFHPRIGHGARMVGGVFEGSTDGFSYTVLYAITQSPPNGWTEVGVNFDAAILSIASGLPLTQVFGAGARYPILAKFAGLDSVSTALAKHGPMKFPICLNAL